MELTTTTHHDVKEEGKKKKKKKKKKTMCGLGAGCSLDDALLRWRVPWSHGVDAMRCY